MCKDFRLFTENFISKLENTDDLVIWYQWNQDNDSYLVKELQEGSVQDAIDLISSQLIAFLQHVYIKRQQAISYESQKADAQLPDCTSCILQMDFAENYTATFQDEIQSVHWKQKQITKYTIMIWHRSEINSKIFVSNCRDHEKHSVAAYTAKILEFIELSLPTVDTVQIWTDGPSSQYKSKFVFILSTKLKEVSDLQLQWNYFATSHGKGPNDALGGNAKRIAHRQVLSRKFVIRDALSFSAAFKSVQSNINVTVISPNEIETKCNELNADLLWSDVPAVPGTQTVHCVIPQQNSVKCKMYTNAVNVKQHVMIKTTTETITPASTSITPSMDFISTPLTMDAGSTPPTVDASISRQYFQ